MANRAIWWNPIWTPAPSACVSNIPISYPNLRPVGLSPEDRQAVCDYAVKRIGLEYDLKNIIDLGRYLVPLPVPQRWRRRMIALGSGDPTKLICSALIARAFGAIGYPILPAIERVESAQARREIYHIRDSSLYCPRDFDISPISP